MNYIFAILSVCLVVVNCQSRPPRPPPSGTSVGTPVSIAFPAPTRAAPQAKVSPPRPKGCSPGCGPTEICAELGASYCRGGQVCSVCIKMSSIRFPASALAGMFAQQTKPQPVVPAPAVVPVQPPVNPLGQSKNRTQISIIEYAAKQRNMLNSKDNGQGDQMTKGKSKSLPPPYTPQNENIYQVVEGTSQATSSAPTVEINTVSDKPITSTTVVPPATPTSVVPRAGIDFLKGNIDKQQMKYPIIVTVPESAKPISKAINSHGFKNLAIVATETQDKSQLTNSSTQKREQTHLGHMDQTQMTKWYSRYQQFKAQQAQLNALDSKKSAVSKAPAQPSDAFDYASFKQFQQWLKRKTHQQQQQQQQQQEQQNMQAPITLAQKVVTPVVQPQPVINPKTKPLVPVAQQTTPVAKATAQPPNTYGHDSFQQQYEQWQRQQNQVQVPVTPKTITIEPLPQPTLPGAYMPAQRSNALDYASMQQQFQKWQQQQQQNQVQLPVVPPQINTVDSVAQQTVPTAQATSAQQPNTFDYAAFQQQYQQWQQNQAQQNNGKQSVAVNPVGSIAKPAVPAAPAQQPNTIDYSAFQKQWQQQQEYQQSQEKPTGAQALPVPNIEQTQPATQEIQNTIHQNSQRSPQQQQQNTYSYMPQQPVNNYNNDPFNFFNHYPQQQQQNTYSNYYNPMPQDNNLLGLMMFDGMGFGGGFGF